MGPTFSKKRKLEDASKRTSRPKKKFRKQTNYHSSSSSPSGDEFEAVDLADTDSEAEISSKAPNPSKLSNSNKTPRLLKNSKSDASSDADSDLASDSQTSQTSQSPHSKRKLPKRHDPLAFSTSLSTILASKLPSQSRLDPVLSRSATAKEASHTLSEAKLEAKARKALRAEKKIAAEKGRVRDVLLGDRPKTSSIALTSGRDDRGGRGVGTEGGEGRMGKSAQEILEQERRLRKTAQRGVVRLFNAVRAAQVKGEEAVREARAKGLVGSKRREERVGEMGKQAFLELVAGGGKVGEGVV